MSQELKSVKLFELTYDDGISKQILDVPHELYDDEVFQKNLIYFKCKECGLEYEVKPC